MPRYFCLDVYYTYAFFYQMIHISLQFCLHFNRKLIWIHRRNKRLKSQHWQPNLDSLRPHWGKTYWDVKVFRKYFVLFLSKIILFDELEVNSLIFLTSLWAFFASMYYSGLPPAFVSCIWRHESLLNIAWVSSIFGPMSRMVSHDFRTSWKTCDHAKSNEGK